MTSGLLNIQVSGKISELKTTIDIGLNHRGNLLKNISYQFEQWNNLVSHIFLYRSSFLDLQGILILVSNSS